ncbi:hypothetical protein SDC9_170649 [bioreactor metagenome]|uniref:Uncharacterized protein n=1 Tax=bioreactor metagenome TaxID=1076179 RepID=A0A645G8M0_9ZZZZ
MFAGGCALRPCLLGIRFRCGYASGCARRGCAQTNLRKIVVKRALGFACQGGFASGSRLLHTLICVNICVSKQRAFRLWLMVAGKVALRPCLFGIRLRRGYRGRCRGRFGTRRELFRLIRRCAFGAFRFFRRYRILRYFAIRVKRLVKILVHCAGNI